LDVISSLLQLGIQHPSGIILL